MSEAGRDESALERWWRGGARVVLPRGRLGAGHAIHCRVDGDSGPWLTLIHGFPTSSFDFAALVPRLARHHRVLTLDLFGYGASDKPGALRYGTPLHADTLEALFVHFGIDATSLLAHDIGTAIAQELLFRHDDGRLATRLERVTLLNGVVIVDRYRPAILQRLLSSRWTGPIMSALHHEALFARNLKRAFGPSTPLDDDACRLHYRAMQERDGHRQLHRLAYYVHERLREGPRWQRALLATRVPLRFVWGMADPYAGAFVAEDVRRLLPHAPLRELPSVGHFPHLEDPSSVLEDLLVA